MLLPHETAVSYFAVIAIMPYWPPANESLLNMIAAAGLQVVFSTKDTYAMNNSEAFVKAQVSKWKDHESVLGWCVV